MHLELDPHPHPHPHPARQKGILPWLLIAAITGVSAFLALGKGSMDERTAARRFHEGVALIEQYSYEAAFDAFSEVVEAYPDWTTARFNRGLAALNLYSTHLKVAEAEFREVLRVDPRSLHAHFALGHLFKFQVRLKEALAAFETVAKGDPGDPYALYEYGAALQDEGRLPEAKASLEAALKIQPAFASAIYRLAQLSQRLGDRASIDAHFARFKTLELNKDGIKSGTKYGESGKYLSAIRESVPPKSVHSAQQAAHKPANGDAQPRVAAVPPAPAEPVPIGAVFAIQKRPDGSVAPPAFALGDVDGDAALDLVLCGQPGGGGMHAEIWKGGPNGISFQKKAELPADGSSVAVGDIDGDSDLDVLLAAPGSLRLFDNDGRGNFAASTQKLPEAPPGFPVQALVFDADSDWDLDAVVVTQIEEGGKVATALAILQNNRDGSFTDVAPKVGLARMSQVSRGALFADFDGDIDADVLCLAAGLDDGTVLFNDRAWTYRQVPAKEVGGLAALLQKAMLAPRIAQAIAAAPSGTEPPASLAIIRDSAGRPFSIEARAGDSLKLRPIADAPSTWIAFDLNGPKEGKPGVTWSNLAGIGATVEVRAGGRALLSQVLAEGTGCARGPLRIHFDLGGAPSIDYVRILWPDGVLQVEKGLVVGMLHRIEEMQRKPTSCPILFAWDGTRFAYVGDFLGVGGLGYLEAPGFYSRPDPTEVLELPVLAPVKGPAGAPEYQLRIAEPLEECTYLDAVELIAVDGPADLTLHPDELFAVRAPARPAQLLAYKKPLFPERATDALARDVTEPLRRIDRVYAEGWSRDRRFPGVAEPHSIALEWTEPLPLGTIRGARPVLFLYGYVEYSYSTSNFAASQAGVGLHAPTVSVSRGGTWVPLREEWGFPGGTPRWMAVDLGGLIEPGDRRLRVSTDMEIYWDHAFVAEAVPIPLGETGRRGEASGAARLGENAGVRVTILPAARADLRSLGFPRDTSPDGSHPKLYDYSDVAPTYPMKPFPGRYTRFGDVRDLLGTADDRFAIFGEGEEIAVSFDASRLPELPEGWKRTFFFSAVGYCKDMDLYTAGSDRVEPLPFRAMSGYPPPPEEKRAAERGPAEGTGLNDREIKPLALGAGE